MENRMRNMLSVEEALACVLRRIKPLPEELIPSDSALGRVTSRDVVAPHDIPPYANSAMDGFAVRAEDTARASPENPVRLRVMGEVTCGQFPGKEVLPGTAVRIATGAPLPAGANAVVRLEWTKEEEGVIVVTRPIPLGQDVRPAGEDVAAGEVVIPQGTILRPQEIGMLFALGQKHVWVHRRPKVGILATGDELVEADEPLSPGKIRNVNSYSNAAQVIKYGGIPVLLGIARDRKEEIAQKLCAGLEQGVDLLLISGGVSLGNLDLVKNVLAATGRIEFWQVRMKPGKPLAFGWLKWEGREVPVLGFPGNTVSAMVSFEIFARPAILALQGARELQPLTVTATFAEEFSNKDERRHYLRVRLEEREGELFAYLTGHQGSGVLSSLVKADGLAVIPEEWERVEPGTKVKVILLRP